MSEKEYIVTLQRGIDYDQFWDQIENASDEDGFVPTRRVDIINNRDGSLRSCHYSLTEEEAQQLENDPRVYSVEIPPWEMKNVKIGYALSQPGDFTPTTSDSANVINWGLLRSNYRQRPTLGVDSYDYTLDGTGVDVVIQDSGIQADHPEFFDKDGVSRVQQIDWYAESGLSGTQAANFYTDSHGHGTHVASTATGITQGWAKNARIYAMKLSGLEGSGDSSGLPLFDSFDAIRLWHLAKPIDPQTGVRRPTIVNMSWGYTAYSSADITSGLWRGNSFNEFTFGSDLDLQDKTGLCPKIFGGERAIPVRVSSTDVAVQELIDAGIHVCIASGNSYTRADVPLGDDYNNRVYSFETGTIYYHRGSSPLDNEAIMVGNIKSSTSNGQEIKDASSVHGPAVDIFAAGDDIMGACSTTTEFSVTAPYVGDSNFKQANISGTSMASPQVCGAAALVLQLNPHATPAQLKNYMVSNATLGEMKTTDPSSWNLLGTGQYSDLGTQLVESGNEAPVLYNMFNNPISTQISNS